MDSKDDQPSTNIVAGSPEGHGRELEPCREVSPDARLVHQEKLSSLGRLMAGLAHELTNPINLIVANLDHLADYLEQLLQLVQTLERSPHLSAALRQWLDQEKLRMDYEFLAQDAPKVLQAIRIGAERSASLIGDLRDVSRSDRADLRQVDVTAGIETTLNLLHSLIKHRVRVQRHYAPELPTVLTNPDRLNQVLMNLLTNAAQAIPGQGEIHITVTGNDGGVTITIADSGQGIAPDDLPRIADPWFTTKQEGQGSGLGLWITHNLLESLGGSLRWESQLGRGSTFHIHLPRRPPPHR